MNAFLLQDQDSHEVDYDVDVQGGFDETGVRERAVNNHNNKYRKLTMTS